MPRPPSIFVRKTPKSIGPGEYAKRVITHYARSTPEKVRTAVADQITRRYQTTARLDINPITASEVMEHVVAAAGAQASSEKFHASDAQDADRLWERRRNDILVEWGLKREHLLPRAF